VLLSAATVLGGYAIRLTVFFLILIFLASAAGAQSSCPPLLAPAPAPAKLLFTPRQEGELGEIIRQQFESDFPVIEDDQVTAYLKQVGGSRLPATAGDRAALPIPPL